MTSKQNTVIWLGLLMVAFNLVLKWNDVKAVIFKGAAVTTPSTTQAPKVQVL